MLDGFLNSQMDYIFFVYGLAFVLLAAICITIRHDDPHGLPWAVLGLFGFIHGAGEWLEALALSLGDDPLFAYLRLGVLALSFGVLLEFSRTGWRGLGGRSPGPWIYAPCLIGAVSGAGLGEPGLNVTIRYALGLPGIIWAALTLMRAARAEKTCDVGLVLAATAVLGYAITAGLIVPHANFFPAAALNTESYAAYTGHPIQVVRAILAVLIGASLWAFHLQRRHRALDVDEWPVPYHGWQIAFGLCVVLVAGCVVTQMVGGHADRDLLENMEDHVEVAAAVADTEAIQTLVRSPEYAHPEARRLRLQFQQMLEASPQFRWVHLLVLNTPREVQSVLSVPAVQSASASRFPRIYEHPPRELYDAFAGKAATLFGKPNVLAYAYEEDGRACISGFAPVRELSTGRVIAVLALDLDAERWQQSVAKSRLLVIAVILLISLLLLAFFVVQQRTWLATELIAVSENRLREAQGIAQIGSWTYNPQGDRMSWSQEMFRILGCHPQTAEASPAAFQQALAPEDRPRLAAAFDQALSDGAGHDLEVRCIHPDGSERHLALRVQPKRNVRGMVVRLSGTLQDITARKHAQEEITRLNATLEQRVRIRTAELTEAYAELEAFSYSISHDLRAPLRHIIGFLDLYKKTLPSGLDPQAAEHLENIGAAAARMVALIDALLAFSQIGRAELHRDRVDLRQLTLDVRHELEPDIVGRRINWKIGALPEVTGDAAMLRQVLINLIDNALKFSRTRDPAEIEIDSCPDAHQDIISVRDNGVGFDPVYADKLFGVFQRLHNQTQFKGTGVGLATVGRIVQRHGGRVWAESAEDKGAIFYFTLPRT